MQWIIRKQSWCESAQLSDQTENRAGVNMRTGRTLKYSWQVHALTIMILFIVQFHSSWAQNKKYSHSLQDHLKASQTEDLRAFNFIESRLTSTYFPTKIKVTQDLLMQKLI